MEAEEGIEPSNSGLGSREVHGGSFSWSYVKWDLVKPRWISTAVVTDVVAVQEEATASSG